MDREAVAALQTHAAKHIAAIYLAEPSVLDQDARAVVSAETVFTRWRENFESLAPLAGTIIDAGEMAAVVQMVTTTSPNEPTCEPKWRRYGST